MAQVTALEQPLATSTLQRLLADQQDLYDLAGKLRGVDTRSYGRPLNPAQIAYRLNEGILVPFIGSSIAQKRATPTSLATAITDLGFEVPRTPDQLDKLRQTIEQRASVQPLGNLGGALSWPIPMSQEDQHTSGLFVRLQDIPLPGLPLTDLTKTVLDYLLSGSSVTKDDLQDPLNAVHKLLDTPKAQALGKALQTHLHGISSLTSIYDYTLTALQTGIDRESTVRPKRNFITDFELAHPDNWGKSPSSVVEGLKRHLVGKYRATDDTAPLAAYLLLASKAPQYLIKDIPDRVTIGSVAWVNLTIAAAAIEADQPGAVANMTFADVMSYSSRVTTSSPAPQFAVNDAIVDWGVANGKLQYNSEDRYTSVQINQLRTAFTQRADLLQTASRSLDKEIPTRKEIALAVLKERFGDLGALFEAKVLSTDPYLGTHTQTGLAGKHSLLDVAMMDWPDVRPFKSDDPRIPLATLNNNLKFGVREAFDQQFETAIENKKAAINTNIRHLISQLPLEDRKNFEYGKISFFQESTYEQGVGLWGGTQHPNKPGLLVNVEREGKSCAYKIDFNKGSIEHTHLNNAKVKNSTQGRWIYQTKAFTPGKPGDDNADLAVERTPNGELLDNFSSARSLKIGRAFVEHLNLDDPAIKQQARGQTTLDELEGGPKPLGDFLLNLIPFRSAIANFKSGNIGDGLFDLTLDVFGFLTAGAATAGKLLKIGSSALSRGTKALKATKIIGAAALGELNPLSGLNSLATGGADLLRKGTRYLLDKGIEAVNKLKGADGSYNLLKAASKEYGVLATGTYKVGDNAFEAGAMLHEGKWYAYDPVTARPYGPPLPLFSAKSVAMGGEMQNFRILNNGLGMSEDATKRGLRLTLDAHGVIPEGSPSALMTVDGHHISAYELVDQLKTSGVDLRKYSDIRLTMCNSGTGAEQSFAATLAKLTHKPTEGFKGVMYTSTEVEDVAARMFKNGGAKQREFIDETVNGQKKTIDKFKLTGVDSEHRGVYTHHPDYNPVRFDAEGRLLEAKPLRQSYTADKVDINHNEIADAKVDFDDYDDLT